jgi:hypothetical protein
MIVNILKTKEMIINVARSSQPATAALIIDRQHAHPTNYDLQLEQTHLDDLTQKFSF